MKKFGLLKSLAVGLITISGIGAATGTLAWIAAFVHIDNTTKNNTPISAQTLGAYFAYGNGLPTSQAHPEYRVYGITKPRHLYNLAWLQYLGYFDRTDSTNPGDKKDGEKYGTQFYFELANDLNMQGWVLPPIGTEEHPFVGNFDGNGHVISGLTVSNNFSEYNTHPAVISNWDAENNRPQPHIVGLFGVVGNYNDKYKTAEEQPTYSVFDTQVNQIYDTGITGITVKTSVKDTLMGMAAGYVSGTMTNVAIDSGTITLDKTAIGNVGTTSYGGFTNNISDFSAVGYTTNVKQLHKVTDTIYDLNIVNGQEFNANSQGHNEGWGGSIDMMSMFQRLNNIRSNASSSSTTKTSLVQTTYNYSGTPGTPQNTTYSSGTYGKFYSPTGTNATVGNFIFMNGSSGQANKYMYLGGGTRYIDTYNKYYEHDGYEITDGTNYLCFDGSTGTLSNTTNESQATLWQFSDLFGEGYTTIYTEYNNNTYYLNRNGTFLAAGSSNPTEWTVELDENENAVISVMVSSKEYRVTCVNSSWILVCENMDSDSYYTLSESSRYLTYDNPATSNIPLSTTNANSASMIYVESSTNYLYALSGSTKYYLCLYYTSRNSGIRFNTNPNASNYYPFYLYNGRAALTYSSTRYYIVYDSSYPDDPWWVSSTASSTMTRVGPPQISDITTIYLVNSLNYEDRIEDRQGPDTYTEVEKYNKYTATDTTYFPLNVAQDGGSSSSYITNGNYRPTDANTGYVVSANSLPDSGSVNVNNAMIRVSEYAKNYTSGNVQRNISNSFKYSGSNYAQGTIADSDVRTITDSGNIALTTAYPNPTQSLEKYSDSKSTLLNVLRSSANNYGLHFMNSQISKDDIVEATNISILGESYGNPNDSNVKKRTYQMPVNSIDFRLKEKGYINFFAGTYYSTDVDSFFSLHQIFRDTADNGYQIIDIKEISKIYGNRSHNNWSYAYEFTDGTFYEPYRFNGPGEKFRLSNATPDPNIPYVENNSLPRTVFESTYVGTFGYTKIFDTEWITNFTHSAHSKIYNLDQSYLYYFEVPMNNGEFALGSVSGGTGSYLLYLDIGASASKTQRTTVVEHYVEEDSLYKVPEGVAIIPTSTISGNEPTFNDENTICIAIAQGYKGSIEIERDDSNNITVTRDTITYATAVPSYISDTIQSVVDPGGNADHRGSSDPDDQSIVGELVPYSRLTTEVYRAQYYDYRVNFDSLVKTVITDTRTKSYGGNWSAFTRKITQQVDNGEVVELTSQSQIDSKQIEIYKYFGGNNQNNGTLWSYNDIKDLSGLIIHTGGTNNTTLANAAGSLTTVILELYACYNDGITATNVIDLELTIDTSIASGQYYMYKNYIFTPIVSGGTVTYIVMDISTKTIYIKTVVQGEGGQPQDVLTALEDGESYQVSPQYVAS